MPSAYAINARRSTENSTPNFQRRGLFGFGDARLLRGTPLAPMTAVFEASADPLPAGLSGPVVLVAEPMP